MLFNVFEYACFLLAYLVSNNDDTGIGEQDAENQQQHRGKGRLPRSCPDVTVVPTPRFLHGLEGMICCCWWENIPKYRQQLG
uniref:hypothetical protein n=1 Tax=Salmonella sp. TaxID=599 RepID=UPI001CD949DB|nr:hypothetical protein [Salmonella sp.]